MTIDELESLCQEAARDLLQHQGRPLPAAVVLPAPTATSVTALPDFPDDDIGRFDLLSRFAAERMRPADIPCYGFISEAILGPAVVPGTEAGGASEVVMVVFGARRHRPRVAAATLGDDGIGAFLPSEELDPTAMPFLSPLQHAADAAETADPLDLPGGGPGTGGAGGPGGLPT